MPLSVAGARERSGRTGITDESCRETIARNYDVVNGEVRAATCVNEKLGDNGNRYRSWEGTRDVLSQTRRRIHGRSNSRRLHSAGTACRCSVGRDGVLRLAYLAGCTGAWQVIYTPTIGHDFKRFPR